MPEGLCSGGNPARTSGLPTNACGPGGRGAEGRGDIIRAAPPPAATSPRAGRSIHDIIGFISAPLPPRTPAVGRAPSPARGSARPVARCCGHGGGSQPGGAPRWACLTYSLPRGPAQDLRRGATGPARWRSPKPARRGARRGPGSAPRPSRCPPGPRPPAAAANAGPPQPRPQGRQSPDWGGARCLNPSVAVLTSSRGTPASPLPGCSGTPIFPSPSVRR